MLHGHTVAVALFVGTYLLVATRRWALLPIGRPGGALLGAVLMVALGVHTPQSAWASLNGDTLLLLFGMMMLGGWLVEDGTLARLESLVLRAAGGSPRRLLVLVALSSGALSALLVNDTVAVFLVPLVIRICTRARLPLLPYLLALATSANLGSALTLVGNPQNMLIGALSGIPFHEFTLRVAPAVFAAFVAHLGVLALLYRKVLPDRLPEEAAPVMAPTPRSWLGPLVVGGVLVGLVSGWHMGFTALGGVMVLILARRTPPEPVFQRVDWPLLVFFSALFVVVAGLTGTGLVDEAVGAVRPYLSLQSFRGQLGFVSTVVLGSNVVSNVPMVMLLSPAIPSLGDPTLGWVELAFVSTVAGNLTLMGSVANLIVAEAARPHHEIGFFEYLRVGALSTGVSLAVGVPVLLWLG